VITVQIFGGLGNQMFQYACARSIAIKNDTDVYLDLSRLNENKNNYTTKRDYELSVFKIEAQVASEMDLATSKPFCLRLINALSFKFFSTGIQTSEYFIEKKFSYNYKILKVTTNSFISGYWQSAKYFESIEHQLRREFDFRSSLNSLNTSLLKSISLENSISLHIRRADFAKKYVKNVHGVCSILYYERAIAVITQSVSKPHFFIFSDDIEWARNNLNLNCDFTFVSGNVGNDCVIDMQLMSACKHNIIANSSFSWWGAWLNLNPNKIVIAPKIWFADKKLNDETIDLIPDTWKRM